MTSRRMWRRCAALAVGALLAALAAEGAYRVTRVSSLSPTTNPMYVRHDDELGWSYEPGARARHTSSEFDVEITINERGFRGPSWPATRTGKRVLVLGDSFAFGWGVAYERSFAARLQAEHPEWQVLDAAVSGYATDQELLLARRLVPELAPDVVVCVFCSNDLWEASSDVAYGKHKPRFVDRAGALELTGTPVPRPWLERTSALWRAWQKTRWERAFARQARDRREEWRLVCDLYRALVREQHGTPLVIVSEEDRLAAFAREEAGVHHVDVRTAFALAEGPTSFAHDGHWNELGHAKIARALDAALRALP